MTIARASRRRSGGCSSILVVDDDPIFLRAITREFERQGLRVAVAQTAQAALALARTTLPQVVVLDVILGNHSGFDLMEHLRAILPTATFLFMTASPNAQSAVTAIKLGAVDYVGKPISVDTIMAATVGARTSGSRAISLRTVEKNHILATLSACAGNVSEAARRLGLHRKSLQRKLEKIGT